MLKQLFFCCQAKDRKDEFSSINIDIEDNSNFNSKNNDSNPKNINDKTSPPLNANTKNDLLIKYNKSFNNISEEHNNRVETENISEIKAKIKNNFHQLDKTKTMTSSKNNYQNKDKINSIYIHNFHQERLSYTGIVKIEKPNLPSVNKNSGQNSINLMNNIANPSFKDAASFLSFSNIIVRNKTNTNNRSKSNLSDTEIISSCELILTGEIFFNKEFKVDRFGIKNQDQSIGGKSQSININHRLNKKRDHELKFGVMKNISEEKNIENKDSIKKSRNIPIQEIPNSICNTGNKIIKIKKKDSDFSSSSIIDRMKKNDLDMILNIPQNKINRFQNNNKEIDNNNIIIFTLKYNPTLEIFEFYSCQDAVPLELLLNYNFQLRSDLEYTILLGNVKMKLIVSKNIKNQNVINISVINGIDNAEKKNSNKEEQKNILYTFNPYEDKMPITIGRVNCNINLSNISVSKLHAQINYINDTDEFVVSDLKSTNGTYLILEKPLNFLYINRDLSLRLFESKFNIKYINFDI